MANGKPEPGTAALLEVLGGLFLHTYGIGWIYAGEVGKGLIIMFGWWIVAGINAILLALVIGIFTWPLCWLAMVIISPIMVSNHCKRKLAES